MNSTAPETLRFIPESPLDFSRRAKHFAWLVQRPLQACQELLARAYGFADAHELRAVLEKPDRRQQCDSFQGRVMLDATVGGRLLDALAGGSTPEHLGTLTSREWLARDACFATAWPVHKQEFATLRNSILIEEGREPESMRCTSPRGYGHSFLCGGGEYTIAMSSTGRAILDVLDRWRDEKSGQHPPAFSDHIDRLYALATRHLQNPWVAAAIAFNWFDVLDFPDDEGADLSETDESAWQAWNEVCAMALEGIGLFERLLSEDAAARYAGAIFSTSADGHGNEARDYPMLLYVAACASSVLGRNDEAICYGERACMMDLRDGAGARFLLTASYAKRDRRDPETVSWDELTYGPMLRAVTMMELGEEDASMAALGFALHNRQWHQVHNGYEHAPRTVAGLFKAAAPVAKGHAAAWRRLQALAAEPQGQEVIRNRVSELSEEDTLAVWLDSEFQRGVKERTSESQ